MIIAVDISYPSESNLHYHQNFIVECFNRLASNYLQHQFIYFVDKNFNDLPLVEKNIKTLIVPPYPTTALGRYWWYNMKLPAILKTHSVSVWVSSKSIALSGNTPQCLVIDNFSQLIHPQYFNKKQTGILRKIMPGFVKQAKSIVALSQYCKDAIIQTFSVPAEKVVVIYPGISPIFRPIGSIEKENATIKFTGGVAYFLYIGPTNATQDIIDVLKAFSQFKKWQKSSMQLVIADKNNSAPKEFLASLNTYKYKDDVKIIRHLPLQEYALLTAAAYAVVCPSSYHDFEIAVAEAMQCGVPVIAGTMGAIPEIAGNAALYTSPGNIDEIAKQMILLYKDENKKALVITSGLQQAQQYNWEKATAALWQSVLHAIE